MRYAAVARSGGAVLSLALAMLAAGCSGSLSDVVDRVVPGEPVYKSSRSAEPLEVPPDLSSSTINDTMAIPAGAPASGEATYSEYQRQQAGAGAGSATRVAGVLPQIRNVRVEHLGDKRWLVVRADPAQVWPRVRDFWLQQGFLIAMEDPGIGIMETDWAEKREQFRSGISKFLSKLSSALYGAAIRDKFRTRLERGADPGTTEIYVSHRGVEEIIKETDRKRGETLRKWQPRPADPELEAEMLNRLMVSFGIEQQQARQMVASRSERQARARLMRDNQGGSVLEVSEDFSRAWRRTGLALDRVGFTVEDRDRSRGLYYVRYVDPDTATKSDGGFFSKLKFWGDGDAKKGASAYLISLTGADENTSIVVLDERGERERSATAERILGLLEAQLR